ncbi:ferredoxin [Intrasporangium oryzae NRRL B-24470]|uniref:Ferredoxin n=1 Tax=Intrasporangium oryzae NRRL B-24470 TaxID=1386089 RepID=W9G216_9MICO|nr:FAD-dependent oxidoreductase [Intrasporangium oryzae]EWT00146.1 ferredoxin [Intrasporangium oryzae NRRL B-24470]
MARTHPGTIVVGAGQAGLSLATRLRELGDTDPVVLVGDEDTPPYERPPLSKGYLRGEVARETLVLRDREWLAEHGIELVTGDAVTSVERRVDGGTGGTGGIARLASGRAIEFARLALTTGAVSRALDLPGAGLLGVHCLRTLDDADALAARLGPAREVVVIGGGFIGLEVAAGARAVGKSVTVVEVAGRLLPRAITPMLSDVYLAAHTRRGTRILLGTEAVALHGDEGGAVRAVELADGTLLSADLVVVGVGAVPRTDLALSLGLEVSAAGIVVDEHALASDGRTVAAGDCAVGPNPFFRGRPGPTRLESVPHATDQARTAAETLLGHPAAYDTVPWFWSDQADLRLQIAGLVADADLTVRRGGADPETMTLLSYRDGLLVGGECLGSPHDYIAIKRGLEKGLTIDPAAAEDPTVPLKRLLRAVEDGAGTPGTRTTNGS